MKLFAATVSAAFLLTLSCLTAAPAIGAEDPKIAKKCWKAPHREKKERLCHATIYDVASGAVAADSNVRISDAIVTAVASSTETAWLGVNSTDPAYEGPEYSGLEVVLSGLSPQPELQAGDPAVAVGDPPVAVGDRVTVDGTAFVAASGNWLLATALQVSASGESPSPTEVSATTLLAPSEAGPLDAVLLRVPNQTLVSQTPSEWTMSGGFALGAGIIGELPTIAFPDGTLFSSVTGIGDTLGTPPRLLPRSIGDLLLSS